MTQSDGLSDRSDPLRGFGREAVPSLTWWHLFLWLARQLERYKVSGPSMQPTLHAGTEILVDCRASALTSVRVGDVIYMRHPIDSDTRMIKRVVARDAETGRYTVHGDNPQQSTDSRTFGAVGQEYVLGRVCCTFP